MSAPSKKGIPKPAPPSGRAAMGNSRLMVPRRYPRTTDTSSTSKGAVKHFTKMQPMKITKSDIGSPQKMEKTPTDVKVKTCDLLKNETEARNESIADAHFPGQHLLRNVCVLFDYVTRLQKENVRLHQQVLCLGELCEIEKMKNILFLRDSDNEEKTSKINAATRPPPPDSTTEDPKNKKNSLEVVRSKLVANVNASSPLNNTSFASRLAPKSRLKDALLNQLKMADNVYETLNFETARGASSRERLEDVQKRRRDVFMELNFPQVQRRHHGASGLAASKGFRPLTANFDGSERSSQLLVPSPSARSEVINSTSPTSKFWSKFNFKKFAPTSPLSKFARFARHNRNEHNSSASDSEIEKIASLERIQVKKRKRKISESESFTSSTDTPRRRHVDTDLSILSPSINSARNAQPLAAEFYRSRFDAVRMSKISRPEQSNKVAVEVHVTHAHSETDVSVVGPASPTRPRLNARRGERPKGDIMATSLYTSTEESSTKCAMMEKDPSFENMSSLDASLTVSDDSSTNLVHHVMTLQQKNALLIQQLKDKTIEHETMAERFSVIESEAALLKQTYKFDTELQRLYYSLWQPSFFVPSSMVCDLEGQMKHLDSLIGGTKNDLFDLQQRALESDAKMQASSRQYLDELETLQREHYNILKSIRPNLIFDDEVRRLLDMLPSYNALYSFAIRMIKALKQMRSQMLEKTSTLAQMDMELLQTQSSLLLAHAQSERQRIELRFYSARRNSHLRHTWHGDNVAQRLAHSELSFYLPFRLHGCRIRKPTSARNSGLFSNGPDNFPEAELIQLFKTFHGATPARSPLVSEYASTPVPVGLSPPETPVMYRPKPPSGIPRGRPGGRPPPIYESVPLATNLMRPTAHMRPISSEMQYDVGLSSPVDNRVSLAGQGKTAQDKNMIEESATSLGTNVGSSMSTESTDSSTVEIAPVLRRGTEPPTYPPSPLPLGNTGQVRTLARAFESSRPASMTITSAPVSPVKQSSYSRLVPPTRLRGRMAPRGSPAKDSAQYGSTPIANKSNKPNGNLQSPRVARSRAQAKGGTLPNDNSTSLMESSAGSGSLWSITQEKVSKKLFQRRGVSRMPKLSGIPKTTLADAQTQPSVALREPTTKPEGRLQTPGGTDDKRSSWMTKFRHKK